MSERQLRIVGTADMKEMKREIESVGKTLDGVNKEAAEAKDSLGKIGMDKNKVTNVKRQFAQLRKELQDLTVQYRALNDVDRNTQFGQDLKQRIDELTEKGSMLQDTIEDVQQSLRSGASDTLYWDAASEGLTALISSAQTLTSVLGLSKEKSEDLIKVLVALQGMRALSETFKRIQKARQSQSSISKVLKKLKDNLFGVGNAAITAGKGIKAFSVSLSASPFAAGAAAIGYWTKKCVEAKKAQAELKASIDDVNGTGYEAVGHFKMLQVQYARLTSQQAKTDFFDQNAQALRDMGIEVNNVNDLENVFINNTDSYVDAVMKRAKARAAEKMYEEEYVKVLKEVTTSMPKVGDEIKPSFAKENGIYDKIDWTTKKVEVDWNPEGAVTFQGGALNAEQKGQIEQISGKLTDEVAKELQKNIEEKAIKKNKKLAILETMIGDFQPTTHHSGGGGPAADKEIQSAEERFNRTMNKLKMQYSLGMITQDAYYKGQKSAIEAYNDAILDEVKDLDAVDDATKKIIDTNLSNIATLDDAIGKLEDYRKAQERIASLKAKVISNDYDDERSNLIDIKTPTLQTDNEKQLSHLNTMKDAYNDISRSLKSMQKDYELVNEKQAANIELSQHEKDFLSLYKMKASSLKDLEAQYNKLAEQYNSLNQLEFEKMLKKDQFNTVVDAVSSVSAAITSLYNTWTNTIDKIGDDTASTFEKILSVFDAIVGTVGSVTSAIETISNATAAYKLIVEALTAAKAANLAVTEAEAGAEAKEAVTKAAQTAVTNADTTATDANTSAHAGNAIAKAAESIASVPIVGWILAGVAAASIAAILFSSMNKFAGGGIVPGNSFAGDNQLARVNSGEMILNQQQQANLFDMINRGYADGGTGNVKFEIEGDKLVGAISNHNKKVRRV